MRKSVVRKVFLAFAALCMFAGGASAAGRTAVIAVTSFADMLEPTDTYVSWVVSRYGIGETLTRFDTEGNIVPCLASEWHVSDDRLSWTFKIREGVKFSNGNDMTAEAVKNGIQRVFDMAPRAGDFFRLAGIKAEDGCVVITTEVPVANIPGSLADPLFLIVDTTADQSRFAKDGPICTGPYVVKSFSPTEDCVVVKNPHYWGGEVPFDEVRLRCIDDQTTRAMALKTGEVDIAYNLKMENAAEFEGDERIEIQRLQSLRSTYSFMNQHGPLKDINLRRAILKALDRETYCETLLEGGATPGKAPVPPTLDFGFDELRDENAYDPDGARAILAEAGYRDIDGDGYVEMPDGSPLNLLHVIYTSREELNVYAQAAQADLKEVGIRVTLNAVSYETMINIRGTGKYDMLIWNVLVANTGDPEKFLRENWHSQSKVSTAGYANAEVDRLLDELNSEFDPKARRDLIIGIQQHIMDDAATIFYGYETTFLFSSKRIAGAEMYPMDYYWLTKDIRPAE